MRLYDDVELTFIEASHKYLVSYGVGDKWTEPAPVTGVTTYCGALSKDFMGPWAAKLAAEYVAENLKPGNKTKVIDLAKKQFKLAAEVGARAGKLGHLYVEAKLKGKEVTMPTADEDLKVVESVARAFESFVEDWEPEFTEIEKVLFSRTHTYAGTCDFIARIDGKLVLGDWKTTNTSRYNPDGIYATYFAQLGAYCIAYEEMTGETVDELWVVNLPKDGGEYKLKRLEDIGATVVDCKVYFLALKQAYDINRVMEWSIK